jgi:hypothetical protein
MVLSWQEYRVTVEVLMAAESCVPGRFILYIRVLSLMVFNQFRTLTASFVTGFF